MKRKEKTSFLVKSTLKLFSPKRTILNSVENFIIENKIPTKKTLQQKQLNY